jgi:hypothetical protein
VANVAVSEQQQDGYRFDSGNALTSARSQETAHQPADNDSFPGRRDVPNVKPGQTVDCTFVNVYTNVPTKQVANPTDGVKLGSDGSVDHCGSGAAGQARCDHEFRGGGQARFAAGV